MGEETEQEDQADAEAAKEEENAEEEEAEANEEPKQEEEEEAKEEPEQEEEQKEEVAAAEPKTSFKLKSMIDKIKSEDRWDYDIKFDDDDEEEEEEDDKSSNLLSVAVDSKFKRGNSLVDILMVGPDKLFDKSDEDEA